MATTIRSLTVADSANAIALWHEADLVVPWNDPAADYARAIAAESAGILGAFDDADRLVATAMVGYDGHRGWIYYLATDPSLRRSGVGLKIVRAAEDWLRERGAPKVQLMVRNSNETAVGFYAALGYEVSDVKVLGKRFDT
ncbi:MAG: GNAT family acetyltransferase [Pseudomonadota bacterium]